MNNKKINMDVLSDGTVLDHRYEIKRVVGRGGAGIVYCAYDKIEKTEIAIKELFPLNCCQRDQNQKDVFPSSKNAARQYQYYKDCFEKEVTLMSHYAGDCPNLLKIKKSFKENNTYYYVMEMLSGVTLSEFLRSSDDFLSEKVIINISLEVLNGLSFLHQKGYIHRDICCDNIFLTNEGGVKIIDYGSMSNIGRSEIGTVILRQDYAPPEQYHSQNICGPWTDIYSLGAVMYKSVTKRKVPQVARRLEMDALIPPIKINKQLSPQFSAAIMKALSLCAEDRFQTADEFSMVLADAPVLNIKSKKKKDFYYFAEKVERYIYIFILFLFIVVYCILSFFS